MLYISLLYECQRWISYFHCKASLTLFVRDNVERDGWIVPWFRFSLVDVLTNMHEVELDVAIRTMNNIKVILVSYDEHIQQSNDAKLVLGSRVV